MGIFHVFQLNFDRGGGLYLMHFKFELVCPVHLQFYLLKAIDHINS